MSDFHLSIAPPGSSYYYTLRYVDVALQPRLRALIAFAETIQAIPYECSEAALAQQKLEWWRNDIIQMKMRRAAHPISRALQNAPLSTQFFLDFIDAAESSLVPMPCENFESFLQHVQRTPHLMPTFIQMLSRDPAPETFVSSLTLSVQLAEYIFDFRKMMKAGKLMLLETVPPFEKGRPGGIYQSFLQKISQHAHTLHAQALSALPRTARKDQRFARVYAALQMQRLSEIAKAGFPVMEQQIYLTPLRKLWIAWKKK